ncbi:MAG: hypothetical protein JWO10_941 [Microbacteriaceae bacterium]|nr:hypothetical protein [Microbacteriaceae bacterium]
MTSYASDNNSPPSTPIFEETVSSTPGSSIYTVDETDTVDGADLYESTPGSDSTADSANPSGKAEAVRDEAQNVAGDAKDATKQVAGVTKDQVKEVASEAKGQAKQLLGQATDELKGQAATQQKRVATGLRDVSEEFSSMAESSTGGVASELVRNLGGRAESVATWLDERDPGSLLSEVRSFAARRPGTFIAIAAGVGILAGRLGKSLAASAADDSDTEQ